MPGPYIQSWKKVSTIAKHIQTQSEWEQTMARRVMEQLRGELYLDQRYLTAALGALPAAPRESGGSFATDGGALYYPTAWLLDTYRRNRRYLPRAYLHSLFHCIFRHLWLRDRRDPDLWGLACDIAVEATLDTLNTPATKRPVGWVRQQCYTQLREKCKFLAAVPIYRVLAQTDAETLNKWQREFYTDSHRLWPADPDSPAAQMRGKQWENLGRQTELSMEESGRRAGQDTAAQALQAQVQAGRSRRTYRDFLRRFAVWHEEPHLDPEEFDLGFYSYGLRTYGNLPLIEPLESREVKKVRDFVIVVDTSESTAGELVKAFLKETFTLLKSQDSFFRQCRILVMQADNAVRDEVWLNDLDALDRYTAQFTLVGGGGTDFRPAFARIAQLRQDDVLQRSIELSSMGIRVDKEALLRQVKQENQEQRLELYFHKRLLNDTLPLSIGGGIGQSRLCMFYLRKAHIGEIQASIWPEEMRRECTALNIHLI